MLLRWAASLLLLAAGVACRGPSAAPSPQLPKAAAARGQERPPARPSDSECRQLFARVTRFAEGDALDAEQRQELQRRLERDFMSDCRTMVPAQLQCALSATDRESYLRCEPRPPQAPPGPQSAV